jgi:2'-5' RNA ligase
VLQKYFIAIVPPEPLLSEIQNVKQTTFDNYQSKGALRSPGHITLHMPFNWEDTKEQKLIDCLNEFHFKNSFMVSLKDFGSFEPRVIFINIEEKPDLFGLQKQLVSHVKRNLNLFNQADDMRGFHPHITIAFRDLKKPMFFKMWEKYQGKQFEATFDCDSFCLLKQKEEKWIVYKTFLFKQKKP